MLEDLLDDGILQKFGTPDKDPFWDPASAEKNPFPMPLNKSMGGTMRGTMVVGEAKENESACC